MGDLFLANKAQQQGLASYLDELSNTIKQHFGQPCWIQAEIAHIQTKNHVYLELVESQHGCVISKCSSIIYANRAVKLQSKFRASIGNELSANMKVLVQVSASFHKEYGFSLVVQDIDPTYTLGDMQQQIEFIRQQLKEKKLYDRNKVYQLPVDFFKVAVLSPDGAAGLGDFRADADKLAETGAVTFDYFTAKFQGPEAKGDLVGQLRNVYKLQNDQQTYDCLCIVRGGGAKTDLASLNVFDIANAICHMNLPVVVGIGHERDQTILDEIACASFDTPSKVIGYIVKSLKNRLSAYEVTLKNIELGTKKSLSNSEAMTERHFTIAMQASFRMLDACDKKINQSFQLLHQSANTYVVRVNEAVKRYGIQVNVKGQAIVGVENHHVVQTFNNIKASTAELLSNRLGRITSAFDQLPTLVNYRIDQMSSTVQRNGQVIHNLAATKVNDSAYALDASGQKIIHNTESWLQDINNKILMYENTAKASSPEKVLKHGFAIVRGSDGKAVCDGKNLGNEFTLQMRDRIFSATKAASEKKQ